MEGVETTRTAAALIEWYLETGVDWVLDEVAVDRFEESRLELAARQARQTTRPSPDPARAPPSAQAVGEPLSPASARLPAERPRLEAPPQPVARPSTVAAVPGGGEVMAARAAAASAQTLDALRDILAGFAGCNLRQTAKTLAFADGNPEARVMLIGEAPGREEDDAGVPFVGRSGQLLDRMLKAIGLGRNDVYIANVVPWRPPGNRTPTPQETEICKPFIARQIALARPDLVVLLGAAPAAALLGTTDGILKMRGRWFDYDADGKAVRVLATLHPAYLLRQPQQKRLAWRDFRDLKRQIEALQPTGI
jgi:DNA polymerase